MRIAVIADVHGNLYALQAVLADVRRRGVERVFCAGDLVGYGPQPGEAIALLKEERIPTVMGNYDDAIGHGRLICGCDYKDPADLRLAEKSIEFTLRATTDGDRAYLRSLPADLRLDYGGKSLVVVHGSPLRLNEYLHADTPAETLEMMLDRAGADVLVCGHTHVPYHRQVGARHVINAGSVGKPKHGNPNALYCVLDLAGPNVAATFVEVSYDVEKTARLIEQDPVLPAEFAAGLRQGW
ncbi:MAG: metallophosphoesterase family protein [Bacillota bacterium]|nr:metallophosphoesterase family protein [Bacillota bacterium]